MVQDYGTSPTYSWVTTGLAAGTYELQVWARASGSTSAYQTYSHYEYVLQ